MGEHLAVWRGRGLAGLFFANSGISMPVGQPSHKDVR